ncbi:amino acid ABC transporter permease [Streptomyces xanthochromogenes]|uniref:amino acid ABC transporter permease n=1 Tax=Streptomyces xanthochromogenes TaxID=67384 RepID=UPI002F3E58D2
MAWDEWEQLKTAAIERHTPQMRLDAVPVSSQGRKGDADSLKHSDKPWTHAASVAQDLTEGVGSDLRDLTRAHEGLPRATVGLSSMTTLSSVLQSWDARLSTLREECGTLQPALRQVAVDLGEVDAKTQQQVGAIWVAEVRPGA